MIIITQSNTYFSSFFCHATIPCICISMWRYIWNYTFFLKHYYFMFKICVVTRRYLILVPGGLILIMFTCLTHLRFHLIEFGFILNQYLTLMDAARNAARFASDGLYYQWDNIKHWGSFCNTFLHFISVFRGFSQDF